MRIVCLSDTHEQHEKVEVPDGDILIHAGDMTWMGDYMAIAEVGKWLSALPHKHKIVVAGNHDFLFEKDVDRAKQALGHGHNGITYLQDQAIELEEYDYLSIYGSPWTPRFYDWAFQLESGAQRFQNGVWKEHWATVPEGVDILVTHGPAMGVLDRTIAGHNVGDQSLLKHLARIRPRIHVHGHIHYSYGEQETPFILSPFDEDKPWQIRDNYRSINAAICGENYKPTNKPIVVDI